MTDKWIIIDGVDVSGCEFYNNNYCSCYRDNYGDCYHKCTDEELNNCHYKQLQREKKECERLNKQLILFMNGDYCKNDCSLKQQLKRKEKECETLASQLDFEVQKKECLEQECEELKQTLTEIKEIAVENIRIADLEGLNGVYRRGLAKQILQKISECEVEYDR